MMPGLANRVSPRAVAIPDGLKHLFAINWLYGFVLSVVFYAVLNLVWPQKNTLIPHTIHGTPMSAIEVDEESLQSSPVEQQKVVPTKIG